MDNENQIIKFDTPELNGIEASKAEQIKAIFEPMTEMLSEFEDQYSEVISDATQEIDKDVTAKAKKVRVVISKVRIETEKLRKTQKEEYLRSGKAIDGIANIIKWAIIDKEEKLKEIENHFEILAEKARIALQKDREEQLRPYLDSNWPTPNLIDMEADVWEIYLAAKKKEYADRKLAEKKAEEDREQKAKEEAIQRDKILEENERLRKEAETRRIEEQQNKAIQEAKEIKAREERAALEEKLRIEREEKERIELAAQANREALHTQIDDVKKGLLPGFISKRGIVQQDNKSERTPLETRLIDIINGINYVIENSPHGGVYGYHILGKTMKWDRLGWPADIKQVLSELENNNA